MVQEKKKRSALLLRKKYLTDPNIKQLKNYYIQVLTIGLYQGWLNHRTRGFEANHTELVQFDGLVRYKDRTTPYSLKPF